MELSLLGLRLRPPSEAAEPTQRQRTPTARGPELPETLTLASAAPELDLGSPSLDFLVTNSLSGKSLRPHLPRSEDSSRSTAPRTVPLSLRSLETALRRGGVQQGTHDELRQRSDAVGLGHIRAGQDSSPQGDRAAEGSLLTLSSRASLELSEADVAALRIGRMVLANIQAERAGHSLEALSRFFLDHWLAESGSSARRADGLSVRLLCALQAARARARDVTAEDAGETTVAVKRVGAVALECLDALIAEFGESNPVLAEIRAALLPLIFLRPADRELSGLLHVFSDDGGGELRGDGYFSAYMWRENLLERLERDRAAAAATEHFDGKERLEAELVYFRRVVDELNQRLGESNAAVVRTKIRSDRAQVELQSRVSETELLLRRRDEELAQRRSQFEAALMDQKDVVSSLEQELLDMRRGVEQLLKERGEGTGGEGGSVVLIVETLLNRLKGEEQERKRLQELVVSASPAFVESLFEVAKESASLTARLEAFVSENASLPRPDFLSQWAECVTEEVRFLQELRMQRDELFEMKLKSLHRIYTQAQTQEEVGVVERCGHLIESLQAELGTCQEVLMRKDAAIQRREHEVGKLTETITGMERHLATVERQLSQYKLYMGASAEDGNLKRPKDYENEIYHLTLRADGAEAERKSLKQSLSERELELASSLREVRDLKARYDSESALSAEKLLIAESELRSKIELCLAFVC